MFYSVTQKEYFYSTDDITRNISETYAIMWKYFFQ